MALSDFLDLRTAVIEQIGNADITDVFPRLVKFAENDFNRRLRCREQITDTTLTVSSGSAAIPADLMEIIDLSTSAGVEQVQLSPQKYEKANPKTGFFTVMASTILAADATYDFRYYAKVPTITDSMTDTNWLLAKHPELYLYAVAEKAAKHIGNVELAQMSGSLAETEYNMVAGQDYAERYARARVRVAGVTP